MSSTRRKGLGKSKSVSKPKRKRTNSSVHPAGSLSRFTLSRFSLPTTLPVAALTGVTPTPGRRPVIMRNLTSCFYQLLYPARPPITDQTDLSDLFRPAWLGEALAKAIWEWYGKPPWLEAGLLAQALSYGSVSKVGDLVTWIDHRMPARPPLAAQ
jgi:hypothetical protein